MTRGGWEEWYVFVILETGSMWQRSVIETASLEDRDGFWAGVCLGCAQKVLLWTRQVSGLGERTFH